MNPEWFEPVWKIAAVLFAAGGMWSELRAIRKDIARLEKKQEESNRVKERVARLESSCTNAHKRINELHFGGREG